MAERHDSTRQDEELNRLWNDLASQSTGAGQYDLPDGDANLLSQFHERVTRSQPDSARERAWQKTLTEIESKRSQKDLNMDGIGTINPNGQGFAEGAHPRLVHERTARPMEPSAPRRVRWATSQLALAAVILLLLGVGYRALDPFDGASGGRSSIPAVVVPAAATPGTPETAPATTPYPREGHPVIGSWRWINKPGTPREDVSYAIFSSDGGYVEGGEGGFVAIGIWRATGERTVELVLNPGGRKPLDVLFETGYIVTQESLVNRDPAFLRVFIEIDESGNALTATGETEYPNGDGTYFVADIYTGIADRMVLMPGAAELTPTP